MRRDAFAVAKTTKKEVFRLPLRGTGSDLSSRAVSSQVLSALESLTTVFGMGTGGTSPSLPPVNFRGGFRSFPSAQIPSCFPFGPLALCFASVLSRTLSLLLPASLRSVCFLPFGFPLPLLRSWPLCSVLSPSGPLPSFRISASLSVPSLCFLAFPGAFAPFFRLFPALHFSVHPDNCTNPDSIFQTLQLISLFLSFACSASFRPLCLRSGLFYQALESSPRPISINNLHALPHFQR